MNVIPALGVYAALRREAGLDLPFPGGAPRFVQKASGIDHTIVNGVPFMEHGEHTGALSGRLLRSTD